jgi:hypothetical protein
VRRWFTSLQELTSLLRRQSRCEVPALVRRVQSHESHEWKNRKAGDGGKTDGHSQARQSGGWRFRTRESSASQNGAAAESQNLGAAIRTAFEIQADFERRIEMTKKTAKRGTTASASKKDFGQTRGQSEQDPKGRKGQFTGAGEPPLMKK